jgi:hypothetical protein
MSIDNEKEVLIIHHYLTNEKSTIESISNDLGIDIETVKRVIKKNISNFNVNYEDIS